MPAGPNHHRDISGRILFNAGYEPTVEELVETAKDGFPHLHFSHVIVIIVGKRAAKAARLRLHTATSNWAGYAPNDRPSAQAVLEKSQAVFTTHHPSRVLVGILKDRSVSNELCVGLTIPSIGSQP